MRFIVVSRQCIAAMNIKDRLLQLAQWKDTGMTFDGEAVLERVSIKDKGGVSRMHFTMVSIDEYHIYAEGIDQRIANELGVQPDLIIFPSKHRSKSGKRSLTVHPIGNYGQAEVGGKDNEVSPSAPNLMTEALRQIKAHGSGLDYSISFEVTHHGPLLTTPAFFIEIGSVEECWRDQEAAEAIANALLSLEEKSYPVAVGIGGGHYAPRFSDAALNKRIAFGHMLPNYALQNVDERMVEKVVAATPEARFVYLHRRGELEPKELELLEWFSRHGLNRVGFKELEDL